ncbi:MAG: TetR family transcriptional regulator [Halobacteriovoraceae bacterium]|jgi:AcrR family transcriptional regulator|nr:TetR family transcriptional regulator [Halobacteriovoraceae bacterium]|tara:strand:- start:286 stop:873 length:588 start_codon:yes stop_codon:yes gene_type:complete
MTTSPNKKEAILKTALDLTSKFGLESLSIGGLAKSVGMSKSGLFGHFKSKEKLQIMVMDYAAENFTKQVFVPALKAPRGLPRLDAMMQNWREWSNTYLAGGCPLLSSIIEFDDRPGKIQQHIKKLQSQMISTFEKTISLAVKEGHLQKDSNISQLAYELYSNMIGFHIYSRLLNDEKSYERFYHFYQKIFHNNNK